MLGHSATKIIASTRFVAEDGEQREGFASVELFDHSPRERHESLSGSESASVGATFSEHYALHMQNITAKMKASLETMICHGDALLLS